MAFPDNAPANNTDAVATFINKSINAGYTPAAGLDSTGALYGAVANLLVSPAVPVAKFTTDAVGTATMTAGWITGAQHVFLTNTADGAVTWTTRTATLLFADWGANAVIGMDWLLTISNSGDNTVTITGGTGVTITGTATVATVTTRTFYCTFTSATALTLQGVNKGTIET